MIAMLSCRVEQGSRRKSHWADAAVRHNQNDSQERERKPWECSTGPITAGGKATSALNSGKQWIA
jgi:hypothetical protein